MFYHLIVFLICKYSKFKIFSVCIYVVREGGVSQHLWYFVWDVWYQKYWETLHYSTATLDVSGQLGPLKCHENRLLISKNLLLNTCSNNIEPANHGSLFY
jgi:hypothetical protein